MNPKKILLDSGGTLLAIETDKFKTETLTLLCPMPFSNRDFRLGAVLFSILKRGCADYPDIASLSRHLDDLYDANISTMGLPFGDNLLAGFSVECLDPSCVPEKEDLLRGALETLHKMLYFPLLNSQGLFPEKTFDLEKRDLCDYIRASRKDPKVRSYELCREIMFEGEPYGHRSGGGACEVMAMENREVVDFYHRFIETSVPMYIYIGRRDSQSVNKMIEDVFPKLGGKKAEMSKTVVKSAPDKMREAEEEMPVIQGKLTMGFRSDIDIHDRDFYAAVILNDIFGGSPSSKLFRNVREKQSLCYSCSSNFDFIKGAIFVRSGISNENKERVVGEILDQFEEIKKGNISDFEFDCAKRSIENFYRQGTDSAYALESYYRIRLAEGVDSTLERDIEKFKAVTKADVIRAANRFGADTCAFIRGTLKNGDGGDYYAEDEE